MSDPMLGKQIGDYRIETVLGQGGMGVVYRAEDLALRRAVALKVLSPRFLEDATARARFQLEIRNASTIEHPHVVPVYDAGYDGGFFYLVMRYVQGPDLWKIVSENGPLTESRAMRLVGQIASALFGVHQKGIVHRDVKPQNVLVWNSGEPDEHVFLTDFGIAKALNETLRLTKVGALGTRGYMAPELRDGMPPTASCDQYSLACLAFELLTGRLPFGDDNSDDTETSLGLPIPIGAYAPHVSKRVRETIERALSPEPAKRFPDVRAFAMTDEVSQEAFERSRAISNTVSRMRSDSDLVTGLVAEHGLTDAQIAEIADLEKSQVIRLRRQAARRSLVGE